MFGLKYFYTSGPDTSAATYLLLNIFLLIFLFVLFQLLNRGKLPNGWNRLFGPQHSLKKLLLDSVSAAFSKWWLIVIPIVLSFSWRCENMILTWLYRLNPAFLARMQEICLNIAKKSDTETMNRMPVNLLAQLFYWINHLLTRPMELWQIGVGQGLGIVLSLALCIWLVRSILSRQASFSGREKLLAGIYIFSLIGLALFSIYWVIHFIHTLDQEQTGKHSNFSYLYLFPSFLGNAAVYSFWFAFVYKAVTRPAKLSDEQRLGAENVSLASLTLRLFPAFLFLEFLSFLIQQLSNHLLLNGLWQILPETLIFYLPHLPDYINGVQRSGMFEILFAWIFFPLPFIWARKNFAFRDGFRALYDTWRGHFAKLITSAVIVFAISSPLPVIIGIHRAISHSAHREIVTYEQCLRIWVWPDLIDSGLTAISLALKMIAFVFLIKVFSSGALDLPERETDLEIHV